MSHLRRDEAPVSGRAWAAIEREARRTLAGFLVGRRLVDFEGPGGWELSSASLGRVDPLPPPADGVEARRRRVQPLVELRAPFVLARDELDAVDRGARDPDLGPVFEAARRLALAEDRTIFHGHEAADVAGIVDASPHAPIGIGERYDAYPGLVARAVAALRESGIEGPYGIALGPRCYTGVIETTERGGYPVLEHLQLILGGPVLWAPGVDGAVVVSRRGGDVSLVCGQDVALGYLDHDDATVQLHLEESLTLVVHDPRAAVALTYP